MNDKNITDFCGRIVSKKTAKKQGGRYRKFYLLEVDIDGKPEVKYIEAIQNVVSDDNWNDIVKSAYYGKKYIFYCLQYGQSYRLDHWEEWNPKKI